MHILYMCYILCTIYIIVILSTLSSSSSPGIFLSSPNTLTNHSPLLMPLGTKTLLSFPIDSPVLETI